MGRHEQSVGPIARARFPRGLGPRQPLGGLLGGVGAEPAPFGQGLARPAGAFEGVREQGARFVIGGVIAQEAPERLDGGGVVTRGCAERAEEVPEVGELVVRQGAAVGCGAASAGAVSRDGDQGRQGRVGRAGLAETEQTLSRPVEGLPITGLELFEGARMTSHGGPVKVGALESHERPKERGVVREFARGRLEPGTRRGGLPSPRQALAVDARRFRVPFHLKRVPCVDHGEIGKAARQGGAGHLRPESRKRGPAGARRRQVWKDPAGLPGEHSGQLRGLRHLVPGAARQHPQWRRELDEHVVVGVERAGAQGGAQLGTANPVVRQQVPGAADADAVQIRRGPAGDARQERIEPDGRAAVGCDQDGVGRCTEHLDLGEDGGETAQDRPEVVRRHLVELQPLAEQAPSGQA